MNCPVRLDAQAECRAWRDELVAAGLLIPLGPPGVYGRSGLFEHLLQRFDDYVSRAGATAGAEVMRLPPLLERRQYERTGHLGNFPDLLGSIHGFTGGDREHAELLASQERGEDWSRSLSSTDLVLAPAACYPVYPIASGVLPPGGRRIDLMGFVFRREPAEDPARMQIFRMHEYVRLGTPQEALAHRDDWLRRGEALLRALGLDARPAPANDPFFGRGARLMMATQREQALKYELVVPIVSEERPTAVASSNCHLDHFGAAFGIRTADGQVAHSACVGFGLERVTLALLKTHGLDPEKWPTEVREQLAL